MDAYVIKALVYTMTILSFSTVMVKNMTYDIPQDSAFIAFVHTYRYNRRDIVFLCIDVQCPEAVIVIYMTVYGTKLPLCPMQRAANLTKKKRSIH